MRKCFVLFFFIGVYAFGQEEIEPINTDRSDESEGTYTLPKGVFQVETGITFSEKAAADNLMIRYGLVNGLEMRGEVHFGNDISKTHFNEYVFSVRKRLFDGGEKYPSVAVIGYMAYDNSPGDRFNSDMLLAVDYTIKDKWTLVYNIGSSDGYENLITTGQVGYSFSNRWFMFAEYLGMYNPYMKPNHNFEMGVFYLPSANFQIDVSGGRSLFREDPEYFITFGVSYRFLNKNKYKSSIK